MHVKVETQCAYIELDTRTRCWTEQRDREREHWYCNDKTVIRRLIVEL